jgi:hypothetical protein
MLFGLHEVGSGAAIVVAVALRTTDEHQPEVRRHHKS